MNKILANCISTYPQLQAIIPQINNAFILLYKAFKAGKKVLICGNGGSAADSDHISGELLKGFKLKRSINPQKYPGLTSNIYNNLQGSLPAIPLTSFSSFTTAYGNDVNSDFNFAQLVWGLGKKHDILWAISTSGSSKNIILAAEAAKLKGLSVLAMTNKNGKNLKEIADITLHAPELLTFKVQELHLPIYHTICAMLENAFFGNVNISTSL